MNARYDVVWKLIGLNKNLKRRFVMSSNKDDVSRVTKATKALEAALQEQFKASYAIKREGTSIVVPDFMSLPSAAEAIMKYVDEMDEFVDTNKEFFGHPNDCLVAFNTAVKDSFGALSPDVVMSLFGSTSGQMASVAVGFNETVSVPVGPWKLPVVPVEMKIAPYFKNSDGDNEAVATKRGGGQDIAVGGLKVLFTAPRRYTPLIEMIIEKTVENLLLHSIFKGKAIDSNFNFINVVGFDETRVVYSEHEMMRLQANVFSPIVKTDIWKRSGSPIKRGVLLYGPYGTGKTLTALLTAKRCVENGWTFINSLSGSSISQVIRTAEVYQPSVVFFEDIDSDAGSERDSRVNEILNTIDGLLSKSSEVMVVLTTNHVDRVNKAMLRPGRLDSVIKMGELSPEAVVKLVEVSLCDKSGSTMLEGRLDSEALWKASNGYVSAFIVEAVTKAKAYAISRNGHGDKVRVNSSDVVNALEELRPQFELMSVDEKGRGPALSEYTDAMIELARTGVRK